ncbi:MAG: hypothetical protein V4490_01050 [Pseudomonadota bacterium]
MSNSNPSKKTPMAPAASDARPNVPVRPTRSPPPPPTSSIEDSSVDAVASAVKDSADHLNPAERAPRPESSVLETFEERTPGEDEDADADFEDDLDDSDLVMRFKEDLKNVRYFLRYAEKKLSPSVAELAKNPIAAYNKNKINLKEIKSAIEYLNHTLKNVSKEPDLYLDHLEKITKSLDYGSPLGNIQIATLVALMPQAKIAGKTKLPAVTLDQVLSGTAISEMNKKYRAMIGGEILKFNSELTALIKSQQDVPGITKSFTEEQLLAAINYISAKELDAVMEATNEKSSISSATDAVNAVRKSVADTFGVEIDTKNQPKLPTYKKPTFRKGETTTEGKSRQIAETILKQADQAVSKTYDAKYSAMFKRSGTPMPNNGIWPQFLGGRSQLTATEINAKEKLTKEKIEEAANAYSKKLNKIVEYLECGSSNLLNLGKSEILKFHPNMSKISKALFSQSVKKFRKEKNDTPEQVVKALIDGIRRKDEELKRTDNTLSKEKQKELMKLKKALAKIKFTIPTITEEMRSGIASKRAAESSNVPVMQTHGTAPGETATFTYNWGGGKTLLTDENIEKNYIILGQALHDYYIKNHSITGTEKTEFVKTPAGNEYVKLMSYIYGAYGQTEAPVLINRIGSQASADTTEQKVMADFTKALFKEPALKALLPREILEISFPTEFSAALAREKELEESKKLSEEAQRLAEAEDLYGTLESARGGPKSLASSLQNVQHAYEVSDEAVKHSTAFVVSEKATALSKGASVADRIKSVISSTGKKPLVPPRPPVEGTPVPPVRPPKPTPL